MATPQKPTRPGHLEVADLSLYLRRLSRHSKLEANESAAILSLKARAAWVEAHGDIVSPGETVGEACYVAGGLVGRFDQMLDGRRQITAIHIPGDMCDLHSAVLPKASWSITALTRTLTLRIPHKELMSLAIEHPNIAIAFWRDTALDAAVIGKWYGNMGRKNATARFAHLFCEMGVRMELAGLGKRTSYAFPLIQPALADAMGITAVHANRTLQALRETGNFEFRSGHVTISNWDALATLAEFDPGYLMSVPH
jgi:CRP-like cAMP-binding protein